MTVKISEWLNSNVDSHGIMEAAGMVADFEKSTGEKFPGGERYTHTGRQTVAAIKARGLGGSFNGKPKDRVFYGWEVAELLADHFAPDQERAEKMGRGYRYREAVAALVRGGK